MTAVEDVMSTSNQGRQLPRVERHARLRQEPLVIQSEAQSRLKESGYRELESVSCEFREGVLTLRGRIPSFYLKQVAQTLLRELDIVGEIHNRLEVAAATAAS
jgi:hypothetical protein